jgi:hypothetical protein
LANSTEPTMAPSWSALVPLGPFEPVLGKATIVDISAQGSAGPVPENSRATLSVQPSKVKGATLFIECRYSYGLPSDDRTSSADVLLDLLKDVMDTTKYHSESTFNHFASLLLATPSTQRTPRK